jgi:hypothetical protein
MKKLISVCFLLIFVVIGNAQENKKPKWSELNQDQLNLALTKSKGNIKTGKILTFVGLGTMMFGDAIFIMEMILTGQENPLATTGGKIAIVGEISVFAGIPVWIVGSTRKKKITLELVKFNPKGSASINGIGLKIRF